MKKLLSRGRFSVASFTLIAFFCAADARAETAPKRQAFQFFDMIIRDNVDKAFEDLLKNSPILEKSEQVAALRKQTRDALSLYGKPSGFEVFTEEKFGASIVRLIAVLKFENKPVLWEFYFYKPKFDWILSSIRLRDDFEVLENK